MKFLVADGLRRREHRLNTAIMEIQRAARV